MDIQKKKKKKKECTIPKNLRNTIILYWMMADLDLTTIYNMYPSLFNK